MSSDESETGSRHKRKRKIRRLSDSPASTSSGSPIILKQAYRKGTTSTLRDESSNSDDSDTSDIIKKKRVSRVLINSDSSITDNDLGSVISKRTGVNRKVLDSDSDSNSDSDSDIVTIRRNRNAAPLSMTESESDSQWEAYDSDSENEASKIEQQSNKVTHEEKGIDSDSSDGQSDKCPICLISFRLQEIGVPENCDHSFCLECIQEWSKNMNTCPVDRKEYNSISIKESLDGKFVRKIPIEKPQPENELNIVEDPTFCEICGSNDHEDRLLLCDGCDLGFHLYCLTPPLDEVPEGSWYCNNCIPSDSIDVEVLDESFGNHIFIEPWRRTSTRLIPRTTQSERVRRRIENNRSRRQPQPEVLDVERPSTSIEQSYHVHSNAVSSTTTSRRRNKKKRKRNKPKKYQIIYVVDRITGEAVPIKKLIKKKRRKRTRAPSPSTLANLTTKKRLAAQLGMCVPMNVPQILPNVKVIRGNPNHPNSQRFQSNIENIDLYGTRHNLDAYLPQSDGEDLHSELGEMNILMARRAPNAADVMALRRTARRKAAVLNVPTVSSSTDILGSIMQCQEKILSKNSVMSVDSSGKLKIENKKESFLNNNNCIKPNLNSYSVKQKPYDNRNSTGSGYHANQNWSNSRIYNSVSSQESYYNTPSSSYNQSSTTATTNDSSGEQTNDTPQDYTQRTLCEAQLLQEAEEKEKCTPGSSTPISESDVDIYSDIENETVTTSKGEDDCRPPSPPSSPAGQVQSNTPNTDEDNDSESDMVIDTEKAIEENKEPVTSTVGNTSEQPYSPEQPTSSPGHITYSPGEPTDSPVQSAYNPEQPTPDESSEVTTNIESEMIQCSKSANEDHEKTNSDRPDDDDDSDDGCPNFSIYSRTSKTVALTTDISLSSSNPAKGTGSSENVDKVSNMDINECEDSPMITDINSEAVSNRSELLKEDMKEHKTKSQDFSSGDCLSGKSNMTSRNVGALYSDSEDETVVKKSSGSFAITDIKDITEDILSEEERSYTPLLDEKSEKPKEGLEGLDTEMISDEDRNDFDEAHELKTISDGDALEINAKESELDFTRPEEFEEGEIVDKNKEKNASEQSVATDKNKEKDNVKEKSDQKEEKDLKRKKKNRNKEKDAGVSDKNGNKENEGKQSSFKKLSKTNKERNYRDKDKNKSKSKEKDHNLARSKTPDKIAEKEGRKKKEKRREIERYNVRAIIADKPRAPPKDQFGRDLRRSSSPSHTRSRSASYTPPIIYRSRSASPIRTRRSISKRKSRSISRARTHSRGRRSLSRHQSPLKSKDKSSKRRGRSRNRRSGSRSRSRSGRQRRDRSKYKKRKRSGSKGVKRKKSKEGYRTKSKKRSRISKSRSNSRLRSRSPSVSPKRRRRDWTPSFSRSPSPAIHHMSPSWTPPRIENSQALRSQNLTVILNNDAAKKRKKEKRNKEKKDQSKKRRRERERTPPPSKEVFASGDNILVSVSFNNENETRDVTTRDRRRKEVVSEEQKKKKDRRNKNRKDLSGIKPVAIIDLERSPFQEITGSPKDVIVLSDSDNNENENRNIQGICDSSQQVASPERSPSYSMGPKTPPEPTVKFSLLPKPPQMRAISNPLHEPDPTTDEDVQLEVNNTIHKGPNTPPEEPPTSPPSSPDAYDPFEPTKSRSPTPDPIQAQSVNGTEQILQEGLESQPTLDILEKVAQSSDAMKSLTPPIADIQPADSQSSIQEISDSKSPDQQQRIGVVINQVIQPPNSKPVAQTTPFSSVPTSIITSTAASTNLTTSRINFLSSTVITLQSNIPQRIVLPNQVKSSPVKISPTKATVKSTPIKPIQSKTNKLSKKGNRVQNGSSLEELNLDFDSPYSPGSSDYEDLFEPPSEPAAPVKPKLKSKTNNPQKHQSTFDTLFGGSPTYDKKKSGKRSSNKKNPATSKTKQVGVKIDEDSLKILEELPNSAVEMQVKDKFLKKLNRQERVVEEVKLVLKPYYNKKKVTKDEYKDIMRRAVPKICHNKSGEINPIKIRSLIEAYVKKIKHSKKVTSSSSLPQKVV